ncbi:hypothetical protein BOTBODRAFT_328907 [Botryobasidium botryosum FD-172 SS1]|uniref:Uncharacterized protein n=1 Tax=Botryobasidium botryosum (strain FD-172 SS1) TaxID=930990 RepID=A0A067N2C5_BOTB1|nr:hypothetical protein BOTBODRAFT_328907 [Botryobasidium botryosum FD-172 SS1]
MTEFTSLPLPMPFCISLYLFSSLCIALPRCLASFIFLFSRPAPYRYLSSPSPILPLRISHAQASPCPPSFPLCTTSSFRLYIFVCRVWTSWPAVDLIYTCAL